MFPYKHKASQIVSISPCSEAAGHLRLRSGADRFQFPVEADVDNFRVKVIWHGMAICMSFEAVAMPAMLEAYGWRWGVTWLADRFGGSFNDGMSKESKRSQKTEVRLDSLLTPQMISPRDPSCAVELFWWVRVQVPYLERLYSWAWNMLQYGIMPNSIL